MTDNDALDDDGNAHADEFVAELILGLERAAEGEPDPEIKSRLRGAAAVLDTIGRHVTSEVAAKIIMRSMDL
jgi:hypothetical protein